MRLSLAVDLPEPSHGPDGEAVLNGYGEGAEALGAVSEEADSWLGVGVATFSASFA